MADDVNQSDFSTSGLSSPFSKLTGAQLHDAFELGWTIVELRSRVHIELNDSSNNPGTSAQPNSDTVQAAEQPNSHSPAAPVDSKPGQDESQLLEIQPGAALQRGGLWGSLLNRIALLHQAYFPDSKTAKTLYDIYPEGKARPWAIFPTERPGHETDPDYADLAIPLAYHDKPGGGQEPVLDKFDLYKATRRALNCLILLYLTPDDTLIWDIIYEYQLRLLENMDLDAGAKSQAQNAPVTPPPAPLSPPQAGPLAPAPVTPATTAATTSPNTVTADSQGGNQLAKLAGPPHDGLHPHAHRLKSAQAELTILVVRLLEAWETYLRGVYNRSGLQVGSESRLIALEAGRNMAAISWSMSTDMVGSKATGEQLWEKWRKRFDPEDIIRLQRQVAAMGYTLDELYDADLEHKRPTLAGTAQGSQSPAGIAQGQASAGNAQPAQPVDDDLQPVDPDAPATAADAINHSLDYWQRAIEWLQMAGTAKMVRQPSYQKDSAAPNADNIPDKGTAAEWLGSPQYNSLRAALIEQSNIWHLLLTGQQRLDAYTTETLRFHLQAQVVDMLEGASTDQLIESTAQIFNQVQQLARQAEAAVEGIASIARNGLESLFRNLAPYLILAGVAVGLAAILMIVAIVLPHDSGGTLFGGISATLAAAGAGLSGMGFFTGSSSKNSQQAQVEDRKTASAEQAANITQPVTSIATGIGTSAAGLITQASNNLNSAAVQARKDVEDALNRGLRQVRIETQRLDYSIGVAAPLVEFFVFNFSLQGDYNVLTDVLWSQAERDQELKNIERAAFGPLSMLLGSRSGATPLSAIILGVNRISGTSQWQVNGSVRGKDLHAWSVSVQGPIGDETAEIKSVPAASDTAQPVTFGRLATIDAKDLKLKPGKYKVTLEADAQVSEGKESTRPTTQSTSWIEVQI